MILIILSGALDQPDLGRDIRVLTLALYLASASRRWYACGTPQYLELVLRTERLGVVEDVSDEFPHLYDDRSHPKCGDEGARVPKNATHPIRDTPFPATSTLLLLDVGVLKRVHLRHILRSFPVGRIAKRVRRLRRQNEQLANS